MVIKVGRFGKFLACPGFPECKNTKPLVERMPGRCPKCGQSLFKKSGRGRMKPFCINEACEAFLPEDQRGYYKKKTATEGAEGEPAGEPAAEKNPAKKTTKNAAAKKTATKKTTAKKSAAKKKETRK